MYPSKVYKTITSNKFTGLFIYHDNQKKTLHLLANTLQPLSNIVKPRESTFLSLFIRLFQKLPINGIIYPYD